MSSPQFLLFQVYPCLPLNSCYIQQGQYFFCFLGTLLSLLTAPKICTADSSHNGCETGEIQCEQQKIWKFPWNIWVLQIFISEIPWQKSVALRLLRILFSTCRADKQGGQGNANRVFASRSAPILEEKVGVPHSKASRAKILDSSTFEAAVGVSVNVKSLCFDALCPGTF